MVLDIDTADAVAVFELSKTIPFGWSIDTASKATASIVLSGSTTMSAVVPVGTFADAIVSLWNGVAGLNMTFASIDAETPPIVTLDSAKVDVGSVLQITATTRRVALAGPML